MHGWPAPTATCSRRRRCSPGAPCCANVMLPLEIHGRCRARSARAVRMRAPRTRRTCRASRASIPWQLSGGMQQRVSIARALGFEPQAADDGRAVRRARRDHARPPERAAAAALGARAAHRRLRHPLDPRGGLPVVAHRRDVAAAGAHRRGDRVEPAAPIARWTSAKRRSSSTIAHRVRVALRTAMASDGRVAWPRSAAATPSTRVLPVLAVLVGAAGRLVRGGGLAERAAGHRARAVRPAGLGPVGAASR